MKPETMTAKCHWKCSDMTPCVIEDGENARADDGACVGCGKRNVQPSRQPHTAGQNEAVKLPEELAISGPCIAADNYAVAKISDAFTCAELVRRYNSHPDLLAAAEAVLPIIQHRWRALPSETPEKRAIAAIQSAIKKARP